MKLLDHVEGAFERLIEGSIAKVFRSSVQPAEIGRKLEQAMIRSQVVSVDTKIVANEYQVSLHPGDLEGVASYVEGLSRQLESWLTDRAIERRFSTVAAIKVKIAGDPQTPRRSIRVNSRISDRTGLQEAGRPELTQFQPQEPAAPVRQPARLGLELSDRRGGKRRHMIDSSQVSVGRAPDNDIVIDAPEVSRHHAQLQWNGGNLSIVDLNSKNGTSINGSRITNAVVSVGDKVTFGTVEATVIAGDPAPFRRI